MTKSRKTDMAAADKLFSLIVRDRDGECVRCDSADFLQCAHLVSRSYKTTRCDLDNAVTLCRGCHVYFTHHPLEWIEFCDETWPGRYDRQRRRALSYERVDWGDKRAELTKLAKTAGVV